MRHGAKPGKLRHFPALCCLIWISRHAACLSDRAARSVRGRPKIGAVSSYHRSAAFLPERCACGVLQPDKHLPKRSNLTTSLPAGFSRAKELLYGVRF